MRKSLLAFIGLSAGAGAAYAIGVERNIPIEVEHGLTLAADHNYPKAEGRFPTILIRPL